MSKWDVTDPKQVAALERLTDAMETAPNHSWCGIHKDIIAAFRRRPRGWEGCFGIDKVPSWIYESGNRVRITEILD